MLLRLRDPQGGACPATAPGAKELLRRLLSFDYVLEIRRAAWLPTKDEKMTALVARKVLLPRRLYLGDIGERFRYFPTTCRWWSTPNGRVFVFVQVWDDAESGSWTWRVGLLILLVRAHLQDRLDGALAFLQQLGGIDREPSPLSGDGPGDVRGDGV